MAKRNLNHVLAVEAIADALKQYTTAVSVLEWLDDNDLLDHDHASGEGIRQLAYGYAVRFSQYRTQIEAVINEASK